MSSVINERSRLRCASLRVMNGLMQSEVKLRYSSGLVHLSRTSLDCFVCLLDAFLANVRMLHLRPPTAACKFFPVGTDLRGMLRKKDHDPSTQRGMGAQKDGHHDRELSSEDQQRARLWMVASIFAAGTRGLHAPVEYTLTCLCRWFLRVPSGFAAHVAPIAHVTPAAHVAPGAYMAHAVLLPCASKLCEPAP